MPFPNLNNSEAQGFVQGFTDELEKISQEFQIQSPLHAFQQDPEEFAQKAAADLSQGE